MKKSILTLAAAAALALTACNQAESLNASSPETALAAKNGVSAPKTTLGAAVTVTTSGGSYVVYLTTPKNAGNASNDYCDNGAYMKYKSNTGDWEINGSNPHAQCIEVVNDGASTYTVSFDLLVNYVLSTNGNIQLNFQTCGNELGCSGVNVQYKKNADNTEGSGVITGTAEDGSIWTIDLSQINEAGTAGLESGTRSIGPVLTTDGNGQVGSAVLSW